jgi:hypothetical protein
MQLDLFLDSQAVTLANDAIGALAARDAERASAALGRLRAEAPTYPGIDALERLAIALAAWSAPRADAAAIECAVDWLERNVAPAADQTLGEGSRRFIAAFFRDLADAARGLAYEPARPRAHRAWLCLRCGEWEEAMTAAETIAEPGATPDVIHWRCVARYRCEGLGAARPELFALAWRAPSRFRLVLAELADELLQGEWQRFESASEWESVNESELPEWFPAWYLLEHPAAGAAFRDAAFPASPAAEATRLLLDLLELEKRGHAQRLVGKRARLRELNRELFALYMANRTTRYL